MKQEFEDERIIKEENVIFSKLQGYNFILQRENEIKYPLKYFSPFKQILSIQDPFGKRADSSTTKLVLSNMKSIVNWDKLHLFLDKYPAKPQNSSLNKTSISTSNSKTLLLPTQNREVILVKFPLFSKSHCFVGTFIDICIILIVVSYSYTGKIYIYKM